MLKKENYSWYRKLKKPSFAPPPIVFGIVWSILYPIIFISFGVIFYSFFSEKMPFFVLLPFIINLVLNFLFVPIQFGLKNNLLAALDILAVDTSLIIGILYIYPYSQLLAFVQIPYLLWVLFATVLQFSITIMNWR